MEPAELEDLMLPISRLKAELAVNRAVISVVAESFTAATTARILASKATTAASIRAILAARAASRTSKAAIFKRTSALIAAMIAVADWMKVTSLAISSAEQPPERTLVDLVMPKLTRRLVIFVVSAAKRLVIKAIFAVMRASAAVMRSVDDLLERLEQLVEMAEVNVGILELRSPKELEKPTRREAEAVREFFETEP